MLDTGAAVSFVRKDVWDSLKSGSTFGWRGRHDFHQAFSVDLVVVDSLKVESILLSSET